MNRALSRIAEWGKEHKMNFAPHKTQVIIVTKRQKLDDPKFVMNGNYLEISDSLKILGLTLDKNLTFGPHLENVTKKAINIFKMLSRVVKTQWGLNPEITRLIYTAAVEPVILYAASIWAPATSKKYVRKKLDRITRMFALKICRAHRTTSLAASAVLARIFPLDLRLQENAELYEIKRGKPLEELPGRKLEKRVSPFQLPHPAERRRQTYLCINSQAEADAIENDRPKLYTDGSKIEGKVGAAVSCWNEGCETRQIKIKLASYCSVFQAEMVAILRAVHYLPKGKSGHILSDSRSALDAICDAGTENAIAAEIQKSIREKNINVKLYWIKAHAGILGNERADELAKTAALKLKTAPAYDAFPLSFAKLSIRNRTKNEWQKRYEEGTTASNTKHFFPDTSNAYKILSKLKVTNLRTQLFTSHCGLKAYLHRFKLVGDPFCTCDDQSSETILHILIDCPKYDLKRLECEWRMGIQIREENLYSLIDNDDSRTHFLDYAEGVLYTAAKANGSTVKI